MISRCLSAAAVMLGACVVSAAGGVSAHAQGVDDDWLINGSVFGQVEYRDCAGDDGACAFGENEADAFGELDIRFSRQISQFENWRGSFFGAVDPSEFRGRSDLLSAERFSLVGERGDGAIPWRVELGDYFGFTSLRTLQLPLKGARAEIQLQDNASSPFHSLQVFGGTTARSYNDALSEQFDDTLVAGASHLMELPGGPSLVATGYAASQDTAQGTLHSGVFSLAGAQDFSVADHALELEAEIGALLGETLDGATKRSKGGTAVSASLSGRNESGLRYGARFEDFSQTYRPVGAAVTPDRQFWETRVGHVFDGIGDAELRYQGFRDARSTANQVDTDTFGLSGSWVDLFEGAGGAGTIDAFWRETQSSNGATSNEAWSADVVTNWALTQDWTGVARLQFQQTEDKSVADVDRSTVLGDLSASRRIVWGDVSGTIAPGIVLRRERVGGQRIMAAGPRVAASLFTDDGHSLTGDASVLFQEGHRGATDTRDVSARGRYSFTDGPHTVALTGQFRTNDPDPGRFGSAWQIAASYQFQFATRIAAGQGGTGLAGERISTPAGVGPLAPGVPDITTLALDGDVVLAEEQLSISGFGNPVRLGGAMIYLGRYFERIEQRQRLVLEAPLKALDRAGLIIEFATGARTTREQTYNDVLDELVRHYGAPERVIEDGRFGPQVESDLQNGAFRRIVEWQQPGGVLRFGIPARFDGTFRMELQFAAGFPTIANPFWSFDTVR